MDQKKDKDTQHEMLRTGLRQAVKAFAVLSGVGDDSRKGLFFRA